MIPSVSYGPWRVVFERSQGIVDKTEWSVKHADRDEQTKVGDGNEGELRAKTLAAVLETAGVDSLEVLPPNNGKLVSGEPLQWENWARENQPVPLPIVAAGKAAVAGYLKIGYRQKDEWIASRLGVSEQTVRQYLSDLREGRR